MIRSAIRGSREQLKPSDQPMPLLIGAGAGLSAAAGYDFTSEDRFARDYPGMLRNGFTEKLQKMANFSVGENLLWGDYIQNVAEHDLIQVSHTLFIWL